MNQRIYKFRAWDKENNTMITFWQDLEDNFTINKYGELLFLFGEEKRRLELQQFTGLLDKNGKPIFEGDIVKRDGNCNPIIVEWIEMYAGFNLQSGTAKDIEVIGDIYSNPELTPKQ